MSLVRITLLVFLLSTLPVVGQVRFQVSGSIYLGSIQAMDTASVIQTITNTSDDPLVLNVLGLGGEGDLCHVDGPRVLVVPPKGSVHCRIVARPRQTGRLMDTMFVSDGTFSVWRILACDGRPLDSGYGALVPETDTIRFISTPVGDRRTARTGVHWLPGTGNPSFQRRLTGVTIDGPGRAAFAVTPPQLPFDIPNADTTIDLALSYSPPPDDGRCHTARMTVTAEDSITGIATRRLSAEFVLEGCFASMAAADTALPVISPVAVDFGVVPPGRSGRAAIQVGMPPGSIGTVTNLAIVGPTTDCRLVAVPRTPLPITMYEFTTPLVIDLDYTSGYDGRTMSAWLVLTFREADGDSTQRAVPIQALPLWGRLDPDTTLIAVRPGRIRFDTIRAGDSTVGRFSVVNSGHHTMKILSAEILESATPFVRPSIGAGDSLLAPDGLLPLVASYMPVQGPHCDTATLRLTVGRADAPDAPDALQIDLPFIGCASSPATVVVHDSAVLAIDDITARAGQRVTIPLRLAEPLNRSFVDSAHVTLTYNASMLVPQTPLLADIIRDGIRTSTVRATTTFGEAGDVLVDVPALVTHGDMAVTPITATVIWYHADTVHLDRQTHSTPGILTVAGVAHRLVNANKAMLEVSAAPQPATDNLLVKYRTDRTATLALFDTMGTCVIMHEQPLVAPSGTTTVRIGALAPGTYLLRLSAGPYTTVLPIAHQ